MKIKYSFLFVTSFVLYTLQGESPHMIICTFKSYPELPQTKNETSNSPLQKSFHEATNAHLASHWTMNPKHIQGISASYFGYIDNSSSSGTVVFPRKHQEDSFVLVVTPKINPVFMIENTLDTWQVPQNSGAKSYAISRKQDKQTELYFWDVQELPEVPDNGLLPINAITLFAEPETIYIPTGVTITSTSPQLILPPFYVKKNLNPAKASLNLLDIRCFFEPVSRALKVSGANMQFKMESPK